MFFLKRFGMITAKHMRLTNSSVRKILINMPDMFLHLATQDHKTLYINVQFSI